MITYVIAGDVDSQSVFLRDTSGSKPRIDVKHSDYTFTLLPTNNM